MDVLRFKKHTSYLNVLRDLQFGWKQCQRAFADLADAWLDNSNKTDGALVVELRSKSAQELEGRYLGQAFTVKLLPKVSSNTCLGQVLVFSIHPLSGDATLAWSFHLSQEGDLVSEDGQVIEDGQLDQLHRNFCLLCEACLRVADTSHLTSTPP